MNENYVAPALGERAFNCPYCGAFANMEWVDIKHLINVRLNGVFNVFLSYAQCACCGEYSIWNDDKMIIPYNSTAPMPSNDMPENVKELYNEAREIANKSPRGAAALLRLALDELCDEVNEECKQPRLRGNINDKIAILVKNGLPQSLQKAFDFVRVTGNDAVHNLGIIDIKDNSKIAEVLFQLMNTIVKETITKEKQIDKLYNLIPEERRDKIEERNKKALGMGNGNR